ncbi:uncharacterized protein GGS22DRAFT_88532 [Annulohypoxylon maeteangense]|uniref:uncharacterized protein n=1 Tax=Annulohypoxylon maeteangense TaxID=1927788 RepID=UPI002007DE64|nr:uncharacterized protein GGS22DRAFT_88532 [Annulohypoxylon maeteangense]KAI0887733.1 hypothetical protein GGS22DRAFT_88532 [Annulohypoxylon maeteangense]
MEFFENQVGEVRYLTTLAETPASAPPVSPASQQHNSSSSIATAPGAKRKNSAEESPSSKGPQQRSKRNRYISIACNECKRRKIKCNGETPCQRCGNLNLQCLYAPNCCSSSFKDSDEFKYMTSKVNQLQEQVDALFANMNALRSEALRLAPIQDRPPTLPSTSSTPSSSSIPSITPIHRPAELVQSRQPGFRGPTSTRFNLDVAKNTLHKMGYSNPPDGSEPDGYSQESPAPSPNMTTQLTTTPNVLTRDPLWEFDKDDLVRLCRVHDEEIGIMYPVVKMDSVIRHAKTLSSWMEAARKNFMLYGEESNLKDRNTVLLKLIICCALQIEEHGNSEKAQRLFLSVRPTTDRMLMSDPSDVKNMPILALVAGYYFLANDEILAWRTMGQVTRLCFELGLHRLDAIQRIDNEEERNNAINTFWAAYVLDRRWAFGTGLPFTVPDEEIDPQLPYPDSHPYLVAMITYSKLSARVWRLVRNFEPNTPLELRPNEIEDLDRQIKQWYSEVPQETQLELADWEALPIYLNPPVNSQKDYDIQRLQIWTYLRFNQIRTWLYTPILHTHSSIMENMQFAERAVKLAKNTICYLTHLNNTTNIYRKIQVFYHQFLLAAIAVLFLASCHAPVNFSSTCRNEFYMALELVKDLSSRSWVSQRLWSTIKSLREVAPRLGLAQDPHSSAALTMAGLATGQMGVTPLLASGYGLQPSPVSGAPPTFAGVQNGHQISSEMSRIFEGYMGKKSSPGDPPTAGPPPVDDSTALPYSIGNVYQHFKDMF